MASYNKTTLKEIFKSPFSAETWQELLIKFFHANRLRVTPQPISDPEEKLQGFFLGSIDTPDGYSIGLFRYDVSEGSVTNRRVGLRNLVKKFINTTYGEFDAALVVYDDSENWRLSFICDIKDAATTPKRYSYVFGDPTMQYHTPAERFLTLQSKGVDFTNLREAFSVDALSKQFFDEYRELYADFVQYITGKRYVKEKGKWVEKKQSEENELFADTFASDEKLVRDYIKKMFGRIVFLYFLQRKGWMAGNKNYMHDLFVNSDKKDNFLDGVLEPLFFDLLNTKPELRPSSSRDLPGSENIPYLNGGLFEKDDVDPERCVFPASYFERLFGFLDSYNFTIDENDTEDAEIGIDPEMLGRIFENLLEDNKDKGAFYTPKEIVDYMCRESLIAYLQNNKFSKDGNQLIRSFVEKLDRDGLSDKQRIYLRDRLKSVKICDPAIGSGAFPMGLVNLLAKLYVALGISTNQLGTVKRHIMEQNIYGVDIEKGAVDIARLRFWLAMVVDEKEPQPLPNLHFKIMQGNSLLESYNGITLADMTKVNSHASLFDSDDPDREILVSDLKSYYGTSDHAKRARLFNDIINNVRRQLLDKEIILPTGTDPSENSDFFLWHTWFTDVFENGGFDIVIGNPPYIQLQGNGGSLAKLYEGCKFESFARTGDIYCLFYEQGWRMLKNGGHLCYITSNKWMRAGYGKDLRQFLAKKTNPKLLLDFGGIQVFDSATVDTNILLFSKDGNRHETQAVSGSKQHKDILKNLSDFVRHNAVATDFATSDSWIILSPIEQSIKRKIEAVGTPLKDWDIQINYGIKTGYNEAFIITTEKREEILSKCADEDERKRTDELIRPILRGRDIRRYGYDWANLWLINTHNGIKGKLDRIHIEDYPAVKAHLDQYWDKISTRADKGDTPYNLRNCAYLDDFNEPKLIWGEISDRSKFAYDSNGSYVPEATTFLLVGEEVISLYYFLNSSPAEWYFSKLGPRTGEGTIRWKKYTVEMIFAPHLSYSQKREIENIVSSSNTTINSNNINGWFYKFYGFTPDEQAYIEDYFHSIVKNK